jgi:hypothetical protein
MPQTPLLSRAERFSSRGDLAALLQRLVKSPSLQKSALAKPGAFLRRQGIDLPEGLDIRFGRQLRPRVGKPGPGWEPFSIRMTHCHTVLVKDPETPGKPHLETVCFGFEIVPNPGPGPIG